MKIKLISVLLFLGFLFVVSVGLTNAKADSGRFSEGDRDPPVFCKQVKQVQDPSLSKKRSGLSATNLSSPAREYEDATGEQNIVIVLAAFADQTTNDNDSADLEEKAKEAFFGGEGSESVAEYLKNVSQGKMSLKGDILSGWRILKNSEEYWSGEDSSNFDYAKVLNDTISAIDSDVYLPDYGRIIIILPVNGKRDYASGSVGKWDEVESDDGLLSIGICWLWESDISYQDDLRHELLHTYGFSHSGTIYLKDADACDRLCSNQEITKSDDTTSPPLECSTEEYGDGKCVLGHGRGYPSDFIRWKSGWLNDDQVLVIAESTTIALIPRASSLEGIKMIIIKAKDADGTARTYLFEYFKRLEGFDSSDKNGSRVLVRFFNEEEELNGSGTILLLKKKETEEGTYYETPNLKEESFCDQENGIEIKWTSEQGEEMVEEGSYAELQITLSQKESPTPTPTLIPIPSPTLIPTLPPIPTPSLNPTLPPVPTPEPTFPSEEMTLSVTINGQDATNNDVVVAKKRWTEVEVKARNSRGTILPVDRIDCEITNSKGKNVLLSRYNTKGVFPFKPRKRGKYSLEIEVSKEGFQTASFQTSFKVR